MPAENETDDPICGLKDFLDNKLLFWIEGMNLIGAKTECSSLLKDAESWIERVRMCNNLSSSRTILIPFSREMACSILEQLSDAMNFSAFFSGSPASKSTPHLYTSAISVESGLADLEKLETPVWVYSVNFTSNSYHDTIADYTYNFCGSLYGIIP